MAGGFYNPNGSWPDSGGVDGPSGEIVTCLFEDGAYVAAETDAAIGLKYGEWDEEIEFWLPKSQIDGVCPERGEWIESVDIPEWLAEEKGLEW